MTFRRPSSDVPLNPSVWLRVMSWVLVSMFALLAVTLLVGGVTLFRVRATQRQGLEARTAACDGIIKALNGVQANALAGIRATPAIPDYHDAALQADRESQRAVTIAVNARLLATAREMQAAETELRASSYCDHADPDDPVIPPKENP